MLALLKMRSAAKGRNAKPNDVTVAEITSLMISARRAFSEEMKYRCENQRITRRDMGRGAGRNCIGITEYSGTG